MHKLRKDRDEVTGRFRPGHAVSIRHAGYSTISKNTPLAGRCQVQGIRERLIRDSGGAEPALTAAQAILKQGIFYKNAERNKSEIYGKFLPPVMQGRFELLDNKQQAAEFRQLERRTGRGGGKDVVDHPPGGPHDDISNSCAWACVAASIRPPSAMMGIIRLPGARFDQAFDISSQLIRGF